MSPTKCKWRRRHFFKFWRYWPLQLLEKEYCLSDMLKSNIGVLHQKLYKIGDWDCHVPPKTKYSYCAPGIRSPPPSLLSASAPSGWHLLALPTTTRDRSFCTGKNNNEKSNFSYPLLSVSAPLHCRCSTSTKYKRGVRYIRGFEAFV